MKLIQCVVCGSTEFKQKGQINFCKNCNSIYSNNDLEQSYDEILKEIKDILINDLDTIIEDKIINQQQEKISLARQNLYNALNKNYYSKNSIIESAKILKNLLPKDFFANFFCLIDDVHSLNKFILDNKEELKFIQNAQKNIIIKFLLKSPLLLKKDIPIELSQLISTYPKTSKEWQDFYSNYVSIMTKLDLGFFDTDIPRDVFVAYSSKDEEYAIKVVEYLEKSNITCFISVRNLHHGSGAKENYENELKKAIDNCKIFLFISTSNSRTRDCDALRVEMAYVKQSDKNNFPYEIRNIPYERVSYIYKKPRVEYIIKDDYNGENVLGEKITNEFFASLERVYNNEQLLCRIDTILSDLDNISLNYYDIKYNEPKQVKYCVNCLSENVINAKFCYQCGGKIFNNINENNFLIKKDKIKNKNKVVKDLNQRNYKINDIIEMGIYNNNVLKWEIKSINEEGLLLVSKYSIDCKAFDRDFTNWEISSIRNWLNNDFYLKAFSQEERQRIINHKTNIEDLYPDKKRKKLLFDNNVVMIEDKVFLLTLNDLNKYFKDANSRIKQSININNDGVKEIHWWLSSSQNKNRVDMVNKQGIVLSLYCDESEGIVPAILIKNNM